MKEQTHYNVSVHLAVGARVEGGEHTDDQRRPYARVHVADVVFFTHDPETLARIARTAMASSLRLAKLVEAAKANPALADVSESDVNAALVDFVPESFSDVVDA